VCHTTVRAQARRARQRAVNLVAVLVTANHAAMRLVQIVHRRVMAVLSLARKPVVLAMSAPLVLLLVKSIVRVANTVASRPSPAHSPNRLLIHARRVAQSVILSVARQAVRQMVRSHAPIANRVSKPNFYEMTLMKALLMERFLFFADG
jgi:hypothetical protein